MLPLTIQHAEARVLQNSEAFALAHPKAGAYHHTQACPDIAVKHDLMC